MLLVLGIAGNLEDNIGKLSCNLAGLVAKIYLFAVVDGAMGCCSSCWFQNQSRIGRRSLGCRFLDNYELIGNINGAMMVDTLHELSL